MNTAAIGERLIESAESAPTVQKNPRASASRTLMTPSSRSTRPAKKNPTAAAAAATSR